MLAGPRGEILSALRDMPLSGRYHSPPVESSLGRDDVAAERRRRMSSSRTSTVARKEYPCSRAFDSEVGPNRQARCGQQARQQALPISPIVPHMLDNGATIARIAGSYRGRARSKNAGPRPSASLAIRALFPLISNKLFKLGTLDSNELADTNSGKLVRI